MCGISGYISKNILDGQRMLLSLDHRGPDDSGTYECSIGENHVFLGHNRLSIIDLSDAGHQPMLSTDQKVIVVFNGEIFNYEALRSKYLKNTELKSYSDTEVLLYLYYHLGIGFINLLNGDFAIGILDKRINKLFLIKDRFGVKPLYYFHKDGELIFGSELKALLASGNEISLNYSNLQKYFVFKYFPENSTTYNDVFKLQPGHYLEFDFGNRRIEVKKYYELKKNSDYIDITEAEADSVVRDILKDACRIRLMSDVPVGTFFSGGVDSSIIAYYLKEHKEIYHYTAKKSKQDLLKEGSTSDFYFAELLAQKWNLHLIAVDISETEANSQLINKINFYSDDLIADGSQIPSYLITRDAKKFSTVMLSGMGADELFCGYHWHQLAMLSEYMDKFPGFLAKRISKLFEGLDQGNGRFIAYRRYLHKFGKYYKFPAIKQGYFGVVGDYQNSISILNNYDESVNDIFNNYFPDDHDIFDKIFRFDMDNFLVKNLNYIDRMCMANGIEGRVPYLDHRMVEFAYSLPYKFKISRMLNTKVLSKKAFRGILPDTILNRRKAGFGMPLRSIFGAREKIDELLDKNFLNDLGIFKVKNIDKLIDNHITGREDNSAIIYAIISFQARWKQFK